MGNANNGAPRPMAETSKRYSSIFYTACLSCLFALGGCLEKQPDSEITIGASYGGVGGDAALSNTRIGNLTGTQDADKNKAAPEHAAVEHKEMPDGHGSGEGGEVATGSGAAAEGSTKALTADAAADAGPEHQEVVAEPDAVAHSDIAHVDRPAGYGQDGEQEAAPPGAEGGSLEGSIPTMASPFEKAHEGKEMVVVTGKIEVGGDIKGIADIDCFQPAPDSPAKRKFVNKIKAIAPGEFTMKVPKDYGPLILSAFIDVKSDGPDPTDPQGHYLDNPLTVGSEDISDVLIILETR